MAKVRARIKFGAAAVLDPNGSVGETRYVFSMSNNDGVSVPSRPLKEALKEIALVSFAMTFLPLYILAFPGDNLERVIEVSPVLGTEVLEHIAWGLGVSITVMLGLYVYVISKQRGAKSEADIADEAAVRRSLGFSAELMAGALTPALLMCIAAWVKFPQRVGSLFVIVPAAGIMYSLAARLGGFVVFEAELRLKSAKASVAWAKERLSELPSITSHPIWLIYLANIVVSGLIASVVTWFVSLCIHDPMSFHDLGILSVADLLLAAILVLPSASAIKERYTARSRSIRRSAGLLQLASVMGSLSLVVVVSVNGFPAGGVALLVVLLFCMGSALWPTDFCWEFGRNFSVRGGATASVDRLLRRSLENALEEIRELEPLASEPEQPVTLRGRLLAGVRAFQLGKRPEPPAKDISKPSN